MGHHACDAVASKGHRHARFTRSGRKHLWLAGLWAKLLCADDELIFHHHFRCSTVQESPQTFFWPLYTCTKIARQGNVTFHTADICDTENIKTGLRTVTLTNGTRIESVNSIVNATGYKTIWPFLASEGVAEHCTKDRYRYQRRPRFQSSRILIVHSLVTVRTCILLVVPSSSLWVNSPCLILLQVLLRSQREQLEVSYTNNQVRLFLREFRVPWPASHANITSPFNGKRRPNASKLDTYRKNCRPQICRFQAGVPPAAAELRLRRLLPRRCRFDHAGHRNAVAMGGPSLQRKASPAHAHQDGGAVLN